MPKNMAYDKKVKKKLQRKTPAGIKVRISDTDENPVKTVKTKGGDYPVYKKKSISAQSFRQAFRAARQAGKKIFTWRNRKYTTELK